MSVREGHALADQIWVGPYLRILIISLIISCVTHLNDLHVTTVCFAVHTTVTMITCPSL